jgi:hypothetical protein
LCRTTPLVLARFHHPHIADAAARLFAGGRPTERIAGFESSGGRRLETQIDYAAIDAAQ